MKKNNLLLRLITFLIGLFIMAFGVALSVKANLGVSPISCIPYIYSVQFPLTMGTTTIIFNALLILAQIAVLQKNYRPIQLIQLPFVFIFGFFIDFTLYLTSGIHANNYIMQAVLCLISCVVMGFGVFLEVKAGITYLPGEGLALAIAETIKKEFGKCKISVDSGMVIIGAISSLVLLHSLQGVREGTILAALAVGFLARVFSRGLPVVDVWLGNTTAAVAVNPEETGSISESRLVITISREFGSGGHEIGQQLAQRLGIAFYDRKLIEMTAKQSGFTPEYIEEHEQKLANNLLYDLYEQEYAYVDEKKPPLEALFLVQSKIIREISRKEPCVIVGRCANFILKDQPGVFNVFIHASNEFRQNRAVEEYGVEDTLANKVLERIDRERSNYCWHYTNKVWNDATSYHLTIDSSLLGIDRAVELIADTLATSDKRVRA